MLGFSRKRFQPLLTFDELELLTFVDRQAITDSFVSCTTIYLGMWNGCGWGEWKRKGKGLHKFVVAFDMMMMK